ncbi:hypothetical protein ACDL92_09830 [Ihubacter sp. mB4P-1]|uniref:hypothetical protein n=1 Tax=Ihubacter sp. mB4P-1 TaxID=3242370 RepID=UPI003C7CC3FD
MKEDAALNTEKNDLEEISEEKRSQMEMNLLKKKRKGISIRIWIMRIESRFLF